VRTLYRVEEIGVEYVEILVKDTELQDRKEKYFLKVNLENVNFALSRYSLMELLTSIQVV